MEKRGRLLTEENERIRTIATELQRAIVDKKASNEKEEERLTGRLTSMRDETERLKLIKDVEMRYVRAWEKARREQNVLRYELEMDERQETLNDHRICERNENCVNGALTRYQTRRMAFIKNRIEQWRQRYDREGEMHEKQICKVRNEIEDARKYLEKLTTEYRSNQQFIDTYLAEQAALKRQKEHEVHVERSTIRIQAWWRGIMVRRKLGPYRPEEKKKKRAIKTKK
ncbi:IQ domain-containing protein G [Ooceraea biroi]|nr:IQ domain-containing protein G [Ooceraea biroi]